YRVQRSSSDARTGDHVLAGNRPCRCSDCAPEEATRGTRQLRTNSRLKRSTNKFPQNASGGLEFLRFARLLFCRASSRDVPPMYCLDRIARITAKQLFGVSPYRDPRQRLLPPVFYLAGARSYREHTSSTNGVLDESPHKDHDVVRFRA